VDVLLVDLHRRRTEECLPGNVDYEQLTTFSLSSNQENQESTSLIRCAAPFLCSHWVLTSSLLPDKPLSLRSRLFKTVEKATAYKDHWSMKGNLDDPSMSVLSAINTDGLTSLLLDQSLDVVYGVSFLMGDCKVWRNYRGPRCKSGGARILIKSSKRPSGID